MIDFDDDNWSKTDHVYKNLEKNNHMLFSMITFIFFAYKCELII